MVDGFIPDDNTETMVPSIMWLQNLLDVIIYIQSEAKKRRKGHILFLKALAGKWSIPLLTSRWLEPSHMATCNGKGISIETL